MKYIAPIAALIAAPAFAHEGAHSHPHTNEPIWVAVVATLVVAAAAYKLAKARK